MPDHHLVKTDAAPAAIGPYSQAVVHGGVVYCSGQIAIDPRTQSGPEGTVAEQTRRVMQNLAAVLEAAGSGLSRALRMTIFLVDMDDFAAVNAVYGEFFPSQPPARATVAVRALPKGARVEIDCIAAVG